MKKVLFATLPVLACFTANAQLKNPTPVPQPADITVKARYIATIPSAGSSPRTKVLNLTESPDGTGRYFVTDLYGYIYLIKDGKVSTYLDLKTHVGNKLRSTGLANGLSAMAFHPEFATNGKFYTAHSEEPGSGTADFSPPINVTYGMQAVWMEWTVTDPSADVFSGTFRELLRVNCHQTRHGMQDIGFNPTAQPGDPDYGMLYLTLGDTGSMYYESPGNTGRKDSLYGTVMRIDPLGNNSENGKYGIPSDNPFVNDPEARPEIWALGFRNPHRISWDRLNGNMYLGDIGEINIEEVNLVEPGRNYGWPDREGTWFYNRNMGYDTGTHVYPLPANDDTLGYTYPVAQFDHKRSQFPNHPNGGIPTDAWASIVGGFVYRGNKTPELYGKYVFGEIVSGKLMYIDADSVEQNQQQTVTWLALEDEQGKSTTVMDMVKKYVNRDRADLRLGQDLDGEIYIMAKSDGRVYRLETLMPPSAENPFPGEPGQRETWMGYVDDSAFPWFHQERMGWLFSISGNAQGMWLYSTNTDSWFHTSESSFPWTYFPR